MQQMCGMGSGHQNTMVHGHALDFGRDFHNRQSTMIDDMRNNLGVPLVKTEGPSFPHFLCSPQTIERHHYQNHQHSMHHYQQHHHHAAVPPVWQWESLSAEGDRASVSPRQSFMSSGYTDPGTCSSRDSNISYTGINNITSNYNDFSTAPQVGNNLYNPLGISNTSDSKDTATSFQQHSQLPAAHLSHQAPPLARLHIYQQHRDLHHKLHLSHYLDQSSPHL